MHDSSTLIEAQDTLNSTNAIKWFKQLNEYKSLFTVNLSEPVYSSPQSPMTTLTSKALSGALRNCQVRSLCWRIFLGVLSEPSQSHLWTQQLNVNRERYEQLIQTHIVNPRNNKTENEEDLIDNNPLSQSESNPWSQFFENSELEKVIEQDLLRLYPEHDFFKEDLVVKLMQRVLFLWSKENPDTSYRQGMHELLAPFVLVFYRDAKSTQRALEERVSEDDVEDAALLRHIFDFNYLENDCFLAFERLMIKMKEYFQVVEIPRQSKKRDVTGLIDHNAIVDDTISKTPIHQICNRIQCILLAKKDKELHDYLKDLSIEPQIYLLRWIRLLFGREFHLEDVMMIWDAIFADCGGFRNTDIDSTLIDLSIVEHISIVMLVYIRGQLMDTDFSSCLRRLMKYPPVEDVYMFVEKGLQSRNNPSQPVSIHQSNEPKVETRSRVTPPTPSAAEKKSKSANLFSMPSHGLFSFKESSVTPLGQLTGSTNKPPASPSVTTSLFTTTPKGFVSVNRGESVDSLIDKEVGMGNVMEKVIDVMQRVVLERDEGFDENAFFMCIAELKHVRDVLKFQLPYEKTNLAWMDDLEKERKEKKHTTTSTAHPTKTQTKSPDAASQRQQATTESSTLTSSLHNLEDNDEEGGFFDDPLLST